MDNSIASLIFAMVVVFVVGFFISIVTMLTKVDEVALVGILAL
jgi:hypothetical protein